MIEYKLMPRIVTVDSRFDLIRRSSACPAFLRGSINLQRKVADAFKSVLESLVCEHLNESHSCLCGTVYYAVQGGSNFCVCRNHKPN